MTDPTPTRQGADIRTPESALAAFCHAALSAVGADEATAETGMRAMLHASRIGVDSHGVRLLPHYVRVIESGRVNGRAVPTVARNFGATALVDGDHGLGARVTYFAMDKAMELARTHGVGAVSIRRSSHFAAAGAYAMHAAEAGLIGLCTGNSDSIVRLHEGAKRFHGTNPIAVGVPVEGERPWLFDMATSAIPFNRVHLYRSLGMELPPEVASDADGNPTTDAATAIMLAPLGGAYGYKGAGLAGVAEILSAALTGMRISVEILPMIGEDMSTPRELGAFVLALEPAAFVERSVFDDTIRRYVRAVREGPAIPGGKVLAPGDREWAVEEERRRAGIPLDPETLTAFETIAARFGLDMPARC
jgi:LDH2 family malate/lactate/ureidoglycolate dehydrogenase